MEPPESQKEGTGFGVVGLKFLLDPLQAVDELLGQILLGLGPQQAAGCARILFDVRGEFDQSLHIASDPGFRLGGQGDFFVKERRVKTEINLDVSRCRRRVLFELESVRNGAHQ